MTQDIEWVKKFLTVYILLFFTACLLYSQSREVSFISSDTLLNRAFNWAAKRALMYRGDPLDPAGPWYEGSLPGREAFCIRDISHQCIGAQIMGMDRENINMFTKFVGNISCSKNWCSFWEINRYNMPAPVDYRNDSDFWYNLDANFDIVYACRRLYDWTGNKMYITNPAFLNFFDASLNQYITKWQLEPGTLLERPYNLNRDTTVQHDFGYGYGLPSYAESQDRLTMSADLIAALYQGNISYSEILLFLGRKSESSLYRQKAAQYKKVLMNHWWDNEAKHFNTWYSGEGKFGRGEGDVYLLWFDILRDRDLIRSVILDLVDKKLNIENMSYFPYLFYKNGYWQEAYKYLLYCSDPLTKRRDYPEVSFGVIEGIVQGLMGVSPMASTRTVQVLFRSAATSYARLKNLNVLGTYLDISFEGTKETEVRNSGLLPVIIKAGFKGKYENAFEGDKSIPVTLSVADNNMIITWAEFTLDPGQTKCVTVR
jgi:hypothetical protein